MHREVGLYWSPTFSINSNVSIGGFGAKSSLTPMSLRCWAHSKPNLYRFGFSDDLREKVYNFGIENLYFAYAGEIDSNKGFYYRIQGGTLLIEYDNIQNGANHVHSVVRDLSNDWAESILKNHYITQHHIN